jgi:2-amino-4-hydroxy-6-hydroxymethyldihydropteridine diphosphokinase
MSHIRWKSWPPTLPGYAWKNPVCCVPAFGWRNPALCVLPNLSVWKLSGGQRILSELAIIELGSNIDPEQHIPSAIQAIKRLGAIQSISKMYETEPFGPPGQPPFINAALALETELSPMELRRELRTIEAELGRRRSQDRYAARVIDLDICLYGQQTLDNEGLQIPDPDILKRPYLARTIAEIAPDWVHPTSGGTMTQIADRLDPDHKLQERRELTQATHEIWHGSSNQEE